MATEPVKQRSTPIGKRGRLIKNGPTNRVELQTLGPKAAKAAAKQRKG